MNKYIYTFILAFTVMLAVPANVSAAPGIEIIENEQQPSVTVIDNSTIHVQNANGMSLYIYNVAGVVVQTIKVMGMDCHYDLNLPKGCYIIKVGKVVRKVSIK